MINGKYYMGSGLINEHLKSRKYIRNNFINHFKHKRRTSLHKQQQKITTF